MAPRRYELSDFEWSIIEPLLPNKPRGVPRADDRRVLNGIYWRLRTGSPWADIPERYGPATTCYNRFVRWRKLGVWDRIFETVSAAYDGDLQMVELILDPGSPTRRERQKGGQEAADTTAGHGTEARCMGRSRGGLTTKIHALVDANGLPITLKLSEGQAHDGRSAADMLINLTDGQILLADRAYDSDALRADLAARGAWANVKPMPNRKNIPAFSRFLYRYRNLVERFFSKLKHFRAVATRYEKHDANYLALVKLAAARIWMRFYESVT
ncbi:MAG: IS5 family transposase [Thalassobaculum sp.]